MSFLESLRKNLTPELFLQVTDQLGDDFDYDLVPRSRLNKVIKQRNTLREQLEGHPQPQGSSQDDDEDVLVTQATNATEKVDLEALKSQYEQEQTKAVNGVRIQYAALEKLRAANAIDPELIWQANIISPEQLTVDDHGVVSGLDEIIAELVKSKPHLFNKQSNGVPGGTGKAGGDEGYNKVTTKEDFLKLSTEDQVAFKRANPELFRTFLNS